jgi:4'-phosphopantetheinyl transferase EntD
MTARQNENQKPKLTAEAAYENAHLVAQDQLERIRELLFDLPAPGDDEHPITWANVGSISHVNSKLAEMIAFLDGTN